MSNKVEEVARAIREASPSAGRGDSHLRSQMLTEAVCLDLACAAIEAMREPTEAMENAAGGVLCSAIEGGADDAVTCGAIYRTMIDAALREEGR